ncbi:hypothetical protein ElyMa_004883800 [Elysia marginata]|uniref:Secreted protein n=1 Tax=Elysia marginata TaxID=1093978 RepID=A0AAV4IUP9_9GAST|nr:hypothetical protein ElyMa_004883800 [Elysia marginata]
MFYRYFRVVVVLSVVNTWLTDRVMRRFESCHSMSAFSPWLNTHYCSYYTSPRFTEALKESAVASVLPGARNIRMSRRRLPGEWGKSRQTDRYARHLPMLDRLPGLKAHSLPAMPGQEMYTPNPPPHSLISQRTKFMYTGTVPSRPRTWDMCI